MPDLYQHVAEFVASLKAQIVAARSDGQLSFDDATKLLQYAIRELVRVAATYRDLTGEQKKQAVIAAVGVFYDTVIQPIDLPGPDMIVDPALKKALLMLVSGTIEFFYEQLPEGMQ